MAEIKTPLKRCDYNGSGDEAYIIEPQHTIKDVLRYCLDDLGEDSLRFYVEEIIKESDNA